LFFFLSPLTEGKKIKKADIAVYTLRGGITIKLKGANVLAAGLRQALAWNTLCRLERW